MALSLIPGGGVSSVSLGSALVSVVILNRAHDDPSLRLTIQGPSGAFVIYGGGDVNEVVQLPAPMIATRAHFDCGGGDCTFGHSILAMTG